MNDIDAFILIGGRSMRMGVDKATVAINGVPMIERITASIREAFANVKIKLVAANAEQIARLGGCEPADGFVLDIYEGRGPAGGLYSALASSEKEWAFVIACDLPYVSAELLSFLHNEIADDIDVVVPVQPDGRKQPLASFYRVKIVRDHLAARLERHRPTPSMNYVLEGIRVRRVPFEAIEHLAESHGLFANINSPSDL